MSIHLETELPTTPDRVYELLVNGAKLGTVTGKPGKGGGSSGAAFTLFDGWVEGRQIELVAGERVVQAWRFSEWEAGCYSLVRFTLSGEGDRTRVVVDHSAYPEEYHEHLSSNWDPFYFSPMCAYFSVTE